MAYQALYRKWRPLEFEDVKGQEHIVTTLKIRYGQTESGMRTFSAERAEPVRQPWQRFCKGGQLRASGGRQSVRGMSNL